MYFFPLQAGVPVSSKLLSRLPTLKPPLPEQELDDTLDQTYNTARICERETQAEGGNEDGGSAPEEFYENYKTGKLFPGVIYFAE